MKCYVYVSSLLLLLAVRSVCFSQTLFDPSIKPADAMPENYIKLLKNKRVALVINQTSRVGKESLLDIMIGKKINIVRIFVPEHGFRGTEEAGGHIENATDSATHIRVISLYGSNKKPRPEDLKDIDVMVYDLQDVGARFYTYISTLEYCMEACAQNHKQLMVLDRPNPNGFYVDGPVLEVENRSFVGMQPIPVIYGMTAGEYAQMLVGERWFSNAADIDLKVIKCGNYTHSKKYELPVAPSPNLKNMAAVLAYPSVCLFEGTALSLGRGTDLPFQQYGCPEFEGKYVYSFTPQSTTAAKHPPLENRKCYGVMIATDPAAVLQQTKGALYLGWLMSAYQAYPDKENFFNPFFKTLCGSKKMQEQIKNGATEDEIRASWKADITAFKIIRKKYLLYKDFE